MNELDTEVADGKAALYNKQSDVINQLVGVIGILKEAEAELSRL